jgi:RHS repeat-associated protein
MVVALDPHIFTEGCSTPGHSPLPPFKTAEPGRHSQRARGMGYTAFGTSYAPRTSVSVEQRYTYTGREQTTDPSLMYYRYRMYGSGIGRFVQRDPMAETGWKHIYLYGSGLPTILCDSFGLKPNKPPAYTESASQARDSLKDLIDTHRNLVSQTWQGTERVKTVNEEKSEEHGKVSSSEKCTCACYDKNGKQLNSYQTTASCEGICYLTVVEVWVYAQKASRNPFSKRTKFGPWEKKDDKPINSYYNGGYRDGFKKWIPKNICRAPYILVNSPIGQSCFYKLDTICAKIAKQRKKSRSKPGTKPGAYPGTSSGNPFTGEGM